MANVIDHKVRRVLKSMTREECEQHIETELEALEAAFDQDRSDALKKTMQAYKDSDAETVPAEIVVVDKDDMLGAIGDAVETIMAKLTDLASRIEAVEKSMEKPSDEEEVSKDESADDAEDTEEAAAEDSEEETTEEDGTDETDGEEEDAEEDQADEESEDEADDEIEKSEDENEELNMSMDIGKQISKDSDQDLYELSIRRADRLEKRF